MLSKSTPSTLYFWGMLGLTSFIITPGQKQITKRYFAGYLFGIYGSICKKNHFNITQTPKLIEL